MPAPAVLNDPLTGATAHPLIKSRARPRSHGNGETGANNRCAPSLAGRAGVSS